MILVYISYSFGGQLIKSVLDQRYYSNFHYPIKIKQRFSKMIVIFKCTPHGNFCDSNVPVRLKFCKLPIP